MKIVGGTPSEPSWLYAIAGALLGGGPVWHYLWVNHYPASTEFVLMAGGAAVVGCVIALLARRIGGVVAAIAFAGLLFIFADLQFDPEKYLAAPLLLGLCIAVALLLQRKCAVICTLTLAAFYLAALPRSGAARTAATPRSDRAEAVAGDPALRIAAQPVIVHIILDEHWGIGGLRFEHDTQTANFLSDFYTQRGFEVFPAAYSRFYRTIESIPEIVSLGRRIELAPVNTQRSGDRTLAAVPYFQLLRSRGYEIRVLQNTYLDFCSAPPDPVRLCETRSGNTIANIGYLQGPARSRFILAGRFFLNVKSHIYQRLHPDPEMWRRASAGGGLLALQHLRDAISTGPTANVAYFAHVLVPHRPLGVEDNCDLLDDPANRIGYEQPDHVTDVHWAVMLQRYGAQVRCAELAVGTVLDALDRKVGRDHSVVIIHGDHGSRIFQEKPKFVALSPLSDRQMNGRYSTLLAVRYPGITAGGERRTRSGAGFFLAPGRTVVCRPGLHGI